MSPRSLAPFVMIALLLGSSSQAQNLLLNPHFDSDTAGWTADVGWINGSFDAEDANEPSPSGSILVENTRASGGGNGVFQCVGVTAGTTYDFSIWTRIPTGQAMTGEASLRLFWFGNSLCDFTDFITAEILPITTPSANWTEIALLLYEAPAGAQSVRFDLGVNKDDPGGAFSAKFDAVFMPEPSPSLSALVGFAMLFGLDRRKTARPGAR
jgi:hypothetical protein